MSAPSSSSPSSDASHRSSVEALRAATVTVRELPRLLKVVRSTYRSQDRTPQLEPLYVAFIEHYVRFYHTKPLGLLDRAHLRAFLTHLARRPGMTRGKQEQAHEALRFFHEEVLHQKMDPLTDYVRAPETPTPSDAAEETDPTRSFWTLPPTRR